MTEEGVLEVAAGVVIPVALAGWGTVKWLLARIEEVRDAAEARNLMLLARLDAHEVRCAARDDEMRRWREGVLEKMVPRNEMRQMFDSHNATLLNELSVRFGRIVDAARRGKRFSDDDC